MSSSPERPLDLWAPLLRTLTLGTERAPLPARPVAGDLGRVVSNLLARDEDAAALGLAALLTPLRRAAQPLAAAAPNPLGAAPSDDLPRLPPAAAQYLKQILSGLHMSVLDEWLGAVAAAGRRVPEECLSALLTLGAEDAVPRARVKAVLGRRGEWLASLNPAWEYAVPRDDAPSEEVWRNGRSEQRLAALAAMRALDAPRARAWIESTWAQEGGDLRERAVATLAVGLSNADEPFLESAREDGRRDVRQAAAALLSRLPSSRLVSRMKERVDRCIHKGLPLRVELPETCDASMTADGVPVCPPAPLRDLGERGGWLLQMLTAVPPSHLCERIGVTADVLVRQAAASEWARVLLGGLEGATVAFRDLATARALADLPAHCPHPDVLRVLPPAERARLAQGELRPPLREDHRAFDLIPTCDFPWDEALGRAFIATVRGTAESGAELPGGARALLSHAARWFPTSLADLAARGWPPTRPHLPRRGWLNVYDGFLATVTFRAAALRSLTVDASA